MFEGLVSSIEKTGGALQEFLSYTEHLMDIREAREEVKQKKIIPQEKLFSGSAFKAAYQLEKLPRQIRAFLLGKTALENLLPLSKVLL